MAATLWGTTAVAQTTPVGGYAVLMSMPGASPSAATSSNPVNIPYNGGVVHAHPSVFAVWSGRPSDVPPDALDGIDDYLQGLEGSTYPTLAKQRLFGNEAGIRFGGKVFDHSGPRPLPIDSQNVDLIGKVVRDTFNEYGTRPDPDAVYAVCRSNFPNEHLR